MSWVGLGVPGGVGGAVLASTGTTVTPAKAFALFAYGIASAPINAAHGVLGGPLALELSNCTGVNDGVYVA